MARKLQIKRGPQANLPILSEGELGFTTDQKKVYIGHTDGNIELLTINNTLTLGETSTSAYRGDRGKIAYDHTLASHAPSNAQKNSDITKAEIEAKLTGTITTHNHTPQTSVTGNAGTATKLQTARTINGVSFDGTKNITIADSTKASMIMSTTAPSGTLAPNTLHCVYA